MCFLLISQQKMVTFAYVEWEWSLVRLCTWQLKKTAIEEKIPFKAQNESEYDELSSNVPNLHNNYTSFLTIHTKVTYAQLNMLCLSSHAFRQHPAKLIRTHKAIQNEKSKQHKNILTILMVKHCIFINWITQPNNKLSLPYIPVS